MVVEGYLQMIQAVITRLSTQSTTIKGWCVTVTAALLGFGVNATSVMVSVVAFYVVLVFAFLDGYYLGLERAHRALYRLAADEKVEPWSFAIQRPGVREVLRAMCSPSIALLYGASLAATTAVSVSVALK
ncbi:hypothetical protein [Micromonospora chersina]|uniref:hypothetical protein n=1 Tax=Micromonospora chersina TaxID=47854 RepID=UPI000B80E3BD|nr:hypothetical protein [Micromonospora chersina]